MKSWNRWIWVSLVMIVLCGYLEADRDTDQQPEKVMDVIGVRSGMKIGVAGAGHGYFTFRMSKRVGETGHVYANEINRSRLDYIKNRCQREGIQNISTILGRVEDPLFPKAQLDMVFMCYVFHDLDKPVEFLISIKKSLKPGATVVIMDQDPAKTGSSHFYTGEELMEKVTAARYRLVRTETFLVKDTIYICLPDRIDVAVISGSLEGIRSHDSSQQKPQWSSAENNNYITPPQCVFSANTVRRTAFLSLPGGEVVRFSPETIAESGLNDTVLADSAPWMIAGKDTREVL